MYCLGKCYSDVYKRQDVSLYIAEDTTGPLYCISNQLLNEDCTVSTAIELEEGDQVKVWGYASQCLELQESLSQHFITLQERFNTFKHKIKFYSQIIG